MSISSFADFLAVAGRQFEPQRLLFVFAEAQLPAHHSATQKQRFDARQGGTLTPVMCVDKAPAELPGFAALAQESRRTGQAWDVVFAAVLSGQGGVAPAGATVEQGFKKMITAIQQGGTASLLAFDAAGAPLRFS
jgi:hypothetical protein